MNAFAMATTIWLGLLGQPGPDLELEDVVRRATEACNAAVEAMPRAKGQGRYEYVLRRSSVDGETILHTSGEYSFAYSGEKNWGKFVKSLTGEYDAMLYVSDGKCVMIGRFLDGLQPAGADGLIERQRAPYALPSYLMGIVPQAMPHAWAYFRLPTFGENRATLQKVGDLYVIEAEKEGLRRFYIDPNRAFHLVRYESLTLDRYTRTVVTKDWAKTERGLWYVREYQIEEFPYRARKNYQSKRLTLESIEPNVDIPPEVFTIDALGLPVGAKMKDTRFHPNETIVVRAPKTDVAALEKVIGKLPGSPVPAVARSSRVRLWLVLVNAGALLVIVGFGLRRVARRKARPS